MPTRLKASELKRRRWIRFGSYGAKTPEPVLWRIIPSPDGILALSEYVLDLRAFDSRGKGDAVDGLSRWRDSTLRHWLNSEAAAGEVDFGPHPKPTARNIYLASFIKNMKREQLAYDKAAGFLHGFSAAERAVIREAPLRTLTSGSDKGPAETSRDRVFCISVEEMEDYVGPALKRYAAPPTQQLRELYEIEDRWYTWWNRTPFSIKDQSVCTIGEYNNVSMEPAAQAWVGFRPAFYLDPEAVFEGAGASEKKPAVFVE